jgi:AraC-like DNA-binding protein
MTTPSDLSAVRFSTRDVPARDRVALWREVLGRQLLRLDIEPLSGRVFRGNVCLRALPGLKVMSGSSSACRIERTRELIADANSDVRLAVNCVGSQTLMQRGREIALAPGDATLVSCGECLRAVRSPGRVLGLHIPFAALAALVIDLDDAVMRLIPRDTPALRLLTSYVDILENEDALATPELRHIVAIHVHDLVALAIGATRDVEANAQSRSVGAARLHAIKTHIVKNLDRSTLSLAFVAARQRVTPRYIQMLFEAEGTTFSAFVRGQRLACAYRMLTDPRLIDRNISTVAFDAGFEDLSYFNRRFRRHFAATPSEARTAALGRSLVTASRMSRNRSVES